MEKYFALTATLSQLKGKWADYHKQLKAVGHEKKIRKSLSYYYGQGYFSEAYGITPAGDQGEESRINVNTFRNLLRYQHSLITSERPAFQAVPINSDYTSMASAIAGEEILEYYLRSREHAVEKHLIDATEKAIYSSEGYVALSWDTKAGSFYGVDPESNMPIPQGDIRFKTYNALEVARDATFPGHDANWYILKDTENKFDLAERYPQHSEKILQAEKTNDFLEKHAAAQSDDACTVYIFYHKKTPALPEGKLVIFTDNVKLMDVPLPYPEIPIYRISQATLDGTNLGYSDAFDILGLQEVKDELYSAVVTNNINHAKQCIVVPNDAGFNYRDLADGASLIEVDGEYINAVKALQLTQSSPETYNLISSMEAEMEKKTGINEVIRGDPSANLRSGNALALIAAQSVKFNSSLQHSYTRLLEDVGTAILKFLQTFATTPRFVDVVGKNNRTFLKEFDKETLTGVSKITAEVSSGLSKSSAGRIQIGENLLNMGMVKRPEQYLALLETGRLEPVIDSERTELLIIRSENESLQRGEQPMAILTDTHTMHIKEHRAVLDDPEARKNKAVVKATLDHIAEHEALWAQLSTRPAILQATQMPPSPPQAPAQGSNSAVAETQNAPQDVEGLPNLPNVPPAATPEDQQAFDNLQL